ncbi:MAG: hypothetical protein ACYDAI_04150 [Trichloromonadaceae bacterium]
MKNLLATTIGMASSLLLTSPALAAAVDTTKVYNSGFLVLAFLGFCALIVVAQLLPAIFLLIGSIRSMLKGASKKGRVAARAKS